MICSCIYFGQRLGSVQYLRICIISVSVLLCAVITIYKCYMCARRQQWLSKGCMYVRSNSLLCCSKFLQLLNCFPISSTWDFLNQGLLWPLVIAGVSGHRLRMRPPGAGDRAGRGTFCRSWTSGGAMQVGSEECLSRSQHHNQGGGDRVFQGHFRTSLPLQFLSQKSGKCGIFYLG